MNYIERAIIMAAGFGSRMLPLSMTTPKPLITVHGTPMIETVIEGLHANGIHEIYVVVGYLKEKFAYLEEKYPGLQLVENPLYDTCNNISSLYAVRDHLENAMILDGDQVIYDASILHPDFEKSGYASFYNDQPTNEWLMQVKDNHVVSCSRTGGTGGWQLFSLSRWSREDGKKLKAALEREFDHKENRQLYWDDIALFCEPENFDLGVDPIAPGSILEIDSIEELKEIDPGYCQEGKE